MKKLSRARNETAMPEIHFIGSVAEQRISGNSTRVVERSGLNVGAQKVGGIIASIIMILTLRGDIVLPELPQAEPQVQEVNRGGDGRALQARNDLEQKEMGKRDQVRKYVEDAIANQAELPRFWGVASFYELNEENPASQHRFDVINPVVLSRADLGIETEQESIAKKPYAIVGVVDGDPDPQTGVPYRFVIPIVTFNETDNTSLKFVAHNGETFLSFVDDLSSERFQANIIRDTLSPRYDEGGNIFSLQSPDGTVAARREIIPETIAVQTEPSFVR